MAKPVEWRNRIVGYDVVAADQLLANPANWRIHPKAQQDALTGVLDDVGWVQEIIVNKTTGHVVDGHMRVEVAITRGESVPVKYVELTEAEELLILATIDPISAMAATDAAQLESLLQSVNSDSAAVQAMLAQLAEDSGLDYEPEVAEDAGAQIDKADELLQKWQVERGQLWVIPSKSGRGEHRLLCGDSTNADDVARVMSGARADMVWTDPPYGMNLDTDFSGMSSKMFKGKTGGNYHERVIGDDVQFDPSHIFKMFNYCKEIFLWGADYYAENIPCKNDGSWVVWDKRLDESADKMWGSSFELCWSKTAHKRDIARIKWAGIFGMETQDTDNRVHPTQKPVELARWFFDRWGKSGDIVMDMYLGSGTTLVACEQTGRLGRGLELEPKYCAVILQRLTDMGLTPKLAE